MADDDGRIRCCNCPCHSKVRKLSGEVPIGVRSIPSLPQHVVKARCDCCACCDNMCAMSPSKGMTGALDDLTLDTGQRSHDDSSVPQASTSPSTLNNGAADIYELPNRDFTQPHSSSGQLVPASEESQLDFHSIPNIDGIPVADYETDEDVMVNEREKEKLDDTDVSSGPGSLETLDTEGQSLISGDEDDVAADIQVAEQLDSGEGSGDGYDVRQRYQPQRVQIESAEVDISDAEDGAALPEPASDNGQLSPRDAAYIQSICPHVVNLWQRDGTGGDSPMMKSATWPVPTKSGDQPSTSTEVFIQEQTMEADSLSGSGSSSDSYCGAGQSDHENPFRPRRAERPRRRRHKKQDKVDPTPTNVGPGSELRSQEDVSSLDLAEYSRLLGDSTFRHPYSCEVNMRRRESHGADEDTGPPGCGAIAVATALALLNVAATRYDIEKVALACRQRHPAEHAPLVSYLFSLSLGDTLPQDLISGAMKLSGNSVTGRFFAFYPTRKINLGSWLLFWMHRGCVPIATMVTNRRVATPPTEELATYTDFDQNVTLPTWQHRLISAVTTAGQVTLHNPHQITSAADLHLNMSVESVLSVPRETIVSRFNYSADLASLLACTQSKWADMNVLGQIVATLREDSAYRYAYTDDVGEVGDARRGRPHLTSHVLIPTEQTAGVTLLCRSDSPAAALLTAVPELPVVVACGAEGLPEHMQS